jgi:hypothetical protein
MSLIYPQMPAGSMVQFPYSRRIQARTVVSELADGTLWKQVDDLYGSTEWVMRYSNLSEAEMTQLSDFFAECEGRLKPFTFFDPNGNLLMWSENFSEDVWQRTGALEVSAGVTDPFGDHRASRLANGGGAAWLSQAAGVPGSLQACFSVYVRSDVPDEVKIFRSSGAERRELLVQTGPEWKRVSLRGTITPGAETQEAGVVIPAGAEVDVFGAQLEAQPAMSVYRKSRGQAGIFQRARFGSDSMVTVAEAPGLYSMGVRIVAF